MDAPTRRSGDMIATGLFAAAVAVLAWPLAGPSSRPVIERGGVVSRHLGPAQWLGSAIRRRLGRAADTAADARLARGLVATLVCSAVWIPLGLVAAVALATHAILTRRAVLRRDARRVVDELPELIDLYAVALQSGRNVTTATIEVARRGTGCIVVALRGCVDQVAHGRRLIDALGDLPARVGEPVRPLVTALIASERDGASIQGSLVVLATDARLQRRRDAETRARRVPVAMLFPLVFCVLPAFMFLTVVPVLVEALAVLDA